RHRAAYVVVENRRIDPDRTSYQGDRQEPGERDPASRWLHAELRQTLGHRAALPARSKSRRVRETHQVFGLVEDRCVSRFTRPTVTQSVPLINGEPQGEFLG